MCSNLEQGVTHDYVNIRSIVHRSSFKSYRIHTWHKYARRNRVRTLSFLLMLFFDSIQVRYRKQERCTCLVGVRARTYTSIFLRWLTLFFFNMYIHTDNRMLYVIYGAVDVRSSFLCILCIHNYVDDASAPGKVCTCEAGM